MTARFATIDDYIGSFPPEVRSVLERIRGVVHEAAPAAIEAIRYQMPTFVLDGRSLVHFAAWKNYISVYPVPAAGRALERELAPYRAAKSTVRFPLSTPLPYDLIGRLVTLLVNQHVDRGRRAAS